MEISTCATDDDYEEWRRVRLEVVPGERAGTVAEMRAQDSPDRLLLLARIDGTVVASGLADRSDSAGGGFVAPRVRPAYRRRGVGSALVQVLAEHVVRLGLPELRAMVDDLESLTFAEHLGFVEVDRQVEQVRAITEEAPPSALPAGVEVITLDQRPELWAACFDTFGREVLADFALFEPLQISADQWAVDWAGSPMFLALHDGAVIGCAGLFLDTDRPERAENALTAVSRAWRGRGLASHLKRRTMRWAADNGIQEIYTWTQAGNVSMLRLNEHLGYALGRTSTTLSRPLPL
jgi:GNAT superfamily N-acetyltransferase